MADFKELLSRIAQKFESKKALADALDMDPSRLSRAINTGDFPFNIENCLRLAQVAGEPPSEVLRAADNGDIAELIESLYGPEKKVSDPILKELLGNWSTFTADEKNFVRSSVTMILRSHHAAPDSGLDVMFKNPDGSVTAVQAKPKRTASVKRGR